MKSGAHSPRDEYGNDKKNGGQISKARKEVHGSNPRAGMRNLSPSYRRWGAAASAGSTARPIKAEAPRAELTLNGTADTGKPFSPRGRRWRDPRIKSGGPDEGGRMRVLEFKTPSRSPAAVPVKGGYAGTAIESREKGNERLKPLELVGKGMDQKVCQAIPTRRAADDLGPKDKALNSPRYRWTSLLTEPFGFLDDAFLSFVGIT